MRLFDLFGQHAECVEMRTHVGKGRHESRPCFCHTAEQPVELFPQGLKSGCDYLGGRGADETHLSQAARVSEHLHQLVQL